MAENIMKPEFEPGDVVRLKSGGPLMTVDSVGCRNKVRTDWFDDATLRSGDFAPEELIKNK